MLLPVLTGVTPGVAHGAEIEAQKIPSVSQQNWQGCARSCAGEQEGFSLETATWLEKLWGRDVCGG